MSFIFYFFLTIFLFISLLLCIVVLVQESKSLGLGASFGGDPGDSLFGTSTADVLKKFTAWLAVAFTLLCLVLSKWSASTTSHSLPIQPAFENQEDTKEPHE